MPSRVAVVVPGMMGSTLSYGDAAGWRTEIWGENFLANYRRLVANSTLLRWNGRPAESSVLENVYVGKVMPFPKHRLWGRLLRYLRDHPEFGDRDRTLPYGYDWRQSLPETAERLGARLREHAEAVDPPGEGPRYVFFTHSMGGLVVRIALALGVLDPGRVEKIVHIDSPLEGAPAAFRSAYESGGSLPFLRELSYIFRGWNAPLFHKHLLENVRTFDSIYQLMPPVGHDYLFYTPTHRSNPLAEGLVPPAKRALADRAHELLGEAEQVISDRKIETFTIYGERHKNATDVEFSVQQLGAPNPGYEIIESRGSNAGDGTVPKWSAAGNSASSKQNPLMHVDHATMCNDRKVVGLLPNIL